MNKLKEIDGKRKTAAWLFRPELMTEKVNRFELFLLTSVQHQGMILLFAYILFAVFPLAVTLWSVDNYGGFPSDVCTGNVSFLASNLTLFIIFILMIALCVWRLIRVHDAYYVKTELKLAGVLSVLLIVPGFSLTMIKGISVYGK